ncbi:MAG: NUDIX domain-containing protein [Acholeplasma sp.]|jgi:8-oxo-dGTP pyrophosphatase MutT (NUDIX family)|nr:NUDIX domain-containing protein [Acholeplasma sp.]
MNYCPECGNKLHKVHIDDCDVKQCSQCGFIDWNNSFNVSCVVVAYKENSHFVMVKLKGKEENKITFPGGYRNMGESLEDAARREFFEETGMKASKLSLYKTYTKDELKLIWVVYKTYLSDSYFVENKEVKELVLVKDIKDIDEKDIRGKLTQELLLDLMNDY